MLRPESLATSGISRDEILEEIDSATAVLAQSLGIRQLASDHGGGSGKSAEGGGLALDGSLIATILMSSKGKVLLSRSMRLLTLEQRYCMFSD